MKDIHGIILHTLAELEARSRQLRTQLGEQAGRAAFSQFLAERGLNDVMYTEARDGWHAHFQADRTKEAVAPAGTPRPATGSPPLHTSSRRSAVR